MEGWNRVLIHIYFLRSRLPITSRGWQASFYRGNLSMNGLFFSLNCFQISIKIEEAINDLNESFGIACLRMVKGIAVHHSSWPVITPSPLPRRSWNKVYTLWHECLVWSRRMSSPTSKQSLILLFGFLLPNISR